MRLSVIIVNYNVKYFLEQALYSVRKAMQGINGEVIVVDNHSVDGSVELVRAKFPEVVLIANKDNPGFSKANNQGIAIAKGEYILLLNPDTVVEEDTFSKCLEFMENHPQAGALGVKMVDGKGIFLPESKRSLPTPSVSFFKIFGLSAMFPKSRVFGRYHLGYLNPAEVHEIDVLPGAFMFIRKSVLDKIGWLDEAFFMYGEDIDLSYRVQLGGYKNYYYPHTRIIHYKGESTKKGSLNYVRIFYQAMVIFARKHFSKRNASIYAFFINIAVFLRAIMAIAGRMAGQLALPLMDALLLFGGMYMLKLFWAASIKGASSYYPPVYIQYVVPSYILIWLLAVYFSGGYDRPLRTARTVRGVALGTLIIATIYAFLDESLRFSRGMILLGAVWATGAMIGLRYLTEIIRGRKLAFGEKHTPRIAIVGGLQEARRALSLLTQAGVENRYIGFVSPYAHEAQEEHYLGNVTGLANIRAIYDLDEIIFCSKDIKVSTIIDFMEQLGPELNFKILPENSPSIIGSNSKNTAGDLYAIDINLEIATNMSQRNKRLFDIAVCLGIIPLLPFLLPRVHNASKLVANWGQVFIGRKSWVGYASAKDIGRSYWLPRIKPGVFSPVDRIKNVPLPDETTKDRLNLLYAKDYRVADDFKIVIRNLKRLGA